MERLVQVLDDVDDLLAALRHRLGWWPAARPALRKPAQPPAETLARTPAP